jgi:peptidoglycan/LPS O-acetylase OafA/YrhL
MTTVLDPSGRTSSVNSAAQRGSRELRKFRPDVEGLRAVAVTIVVLSHLSFGFPGGYVGVDVFFVISGFLITRQLVNEYNSTGKISFKGFYSRRAKRILPAATVVIVGTVLACKAWDSPLQVRSDALDGLFSAFSGINWRLAAQGTNYFAIGSTPSPFQHYWSLSVEEQFYFVWPALILAVGWLFGRRFGKRASLVWALVGLIAVSMALSITTTKSSPSWAYFGSQTRVWELAFGALLAVTVSVWTRMPPALASQMSWLGLIFIAISCFVFNSATVYPGSAAILPVVGSAFVIAGGCPGWPRSGELLLKQRPFQFVGNISYSWYLTHWPFLMVLPMALNHSLNGLEKCYVLVGSFVLAAAMYFIVEQPIRSRALLSRRPSLSLGLGGVFVAASVTVALVVVSGSGLPGGGSTGTAQAAPAATTQSAIDSALAASVNVKALSPHIAPSLANATTDRPPLTAKCLTGDAPTQPPPDATCTFGDPSASRTIVVTGDSHANQWMTAFDTFGKANHWKVIEYAKAACSPGNYPTYIDPLSNRLYTQCNAYRTAVLARIKTLKPTYVVLASEIRTVDIDPSGMVQTIRADQAAGSRVIYLEDTPNPEKIGSVPDCLAKHTSNIQACAMSRTEPTTRLQSMIQRRTETQAAQQAGAALIDPTDWFCTATSCPPVINNMIVYADNSHLTSTYATWLTPLLSAAVKKITG